MFRLRKYYLDLVTRDGTALIAYAARLHLGGLRVGYSAVLVAPPDRPSSERSALGRHPLPEFAEGSVSWVCPALELSGSWQGPAPAVNRTLLQGVGGSIGWSCQLTRSQATVQLGSERYSGDGYVECVRLTIAPWNLPFRTLHWGRHGSASHSVVWIAWSGRDNASWIWLDGREQPAARLTARGIEGLEGDGSLELSAGRDLRNRRLLDALGPTIPRLIPLIGKRLSSFHEHKQVSSSSLRMRGTPLDQGWSIHEVVGW
jgi:hypothetical protein